MLPVLVLIHSAAAIVLVATRGLPTRERVWAARVVGAGGAAAGLLLFFARSSDLTWGSFTIAEGRGAVAGGAVFCAWILVIATDEGRGRWEIGALVGAGSVALIGFSLNDWVAPALLFWVCVSAATVVAAVRADAGSWSPAVVGVSDACVVGALVSWALQEETWRMPDQIDGWPFYLAVAGLALRAGALPRVGTWDLAAGGSVAMVPLLIGGSFALLPSLSGGGEVVVALPLLLAGILAAFWCVVRTPQIALAAGWLVATMLALALVEPDAVGKAASAAVLGATGILLWRWAGGRAGPERGLLVAAVPLTVGFGPIVGGATASFERAASAETVLGGAPWTAFAALLPAALAVAVTMGAAIARRLEPETYQPVAVLATWAIAAVALVLGLTAETSLRFDADAELWLYVIAAVAAIAAARFAPVQPVRAESVSSEPALGAVSLPGVVLLVAARAGSVMVAAASIAALAFTYVGLRVGFL